MSNEFGDDTPFPTDFWQSPTIEELAASQGVNPIADVHALFDTWPGEDDDGFEDSIHELRHKPRAERHMGALGNF